MCKNLNLNRQAKLLKAINRKLDLKRDPARALWWTLLVIGLGCIMFAVGPERSIINVVSMVLFMGAFLRLLWVLQRWHWNHIRNFDWRRKHVL